MNNNYLNKILPDSISPELLYIGKYKEKSSFIQIFFILPSLYFSLLLFPRMIPVHMLSVHINLQRGIVSNEDNVFKLQGLRRQKSGPRQETHERIYGMGSGCKAKTGRSVSPASQRRIIKNAGKIMAVSVSHILSMFATTLRVIESNNMYKS